ncbi:arginine--tRNA ligase [Liquorilactobacillus satsumensis]|uniref:arginine--tRNA ligase n=1 Tax=Liquorilactobacillus satsumensis TaxID=259059 RepID=UPI001E492988|nr:arginine--tRNA ligase [Liquorilactobacillus satsumensis]MCC7666707.1 arginine--tRNA ligase [Liquorilactobacillus satsumensis]MCP9312674.1 arginine--tRNA ligase [Liquorilactobacillus satsumensis]MCP9357583.1 arginine--tRNA ligase [Liquorilactobacillus satsumensis]MCP9359860.1 arginine--tRNA ligase [Liquorilactobacillus satsumensis]MCP9371877.1 arginine--tRNA ligase [Liquorilactobacillus satsumensis]
MRSEELVVKALKDVLGDKLSAAELQQALEKPKSLALGDFAFPAFSLAKIFRKAPQQIAAEIAAQISQAHFEKVQAVGPYVNFFLNKSEFSQTILQTVLQQGQAYGNQDLGAAGNVPIDMSSPNIAKPISMGHLRSTVIGNSLAKLLRKANYRPIKINHLGDWGTQFGKLIEAYKLWGSEAEVKADPINKLLEYYVRFHKEDVAHPELDDEARAWFKKLEDGDEEAMRLWKWFRSESLKSFMKIYKKLGVEFDSFNGEAFYNDKMDEIVTILEEKQLLQESRGAQIVDLEKYDLNPALIRKTDGATLYITRDLAAALYRKRTYNFVQSLYVVGNEQTNHFKQLKAVLKEMGEPWADEIHHIPFGLITQGGKKLSTRAGRVILLEEVLDDAVELARQQIEAKNPNLENKEQVAEEVGVGAVIFHDLKNERMNNFDFNLEEVVRFEGETGPYVQYSHARAMSILRKAAAAGDKVALAGTYSLNDPDSWEVLSEIAAFPAMVKRAVNEYEPSVIAKYALHLAKAFNKYYAHTKVLQDDVQLGARLALVKSVATVLKESLNLLGVHAPDRM